VEPEHHPEWKGTSSSTPWFLGFYTLVFKGVIFLANPNCFLGLLFLFWFWKQTLKSKLTKLKLCPLVVVYSLHGSSGKGNSLVVLSPISGLTWYLKYERFLQRFSRNNTRCSLLVHRGLIISWLLKNNFHVFLKLPEWSQSHRIHVWSIHLHLPYYQMQVNIPYTDPMGKEEGRKVGPRWDSRYCW